MNTNYLSLNAELTTRISKISPYKAEDNFNEYYDAITKELIDACVEQGISESILTFIFHSEKILKRVVSDEAYLEILNEMRDGSILEYLINVTMDQYVIDYMLRYKTKPEMMFYGNITEDILAHARDLTALIHKSVYYRVLNQLDKETVRKTLDEYLYDEISKHVHEGLGINGVYAKLITLKLKVDNERFKASKIAFAARLVRQYEK